MARIGYARVSTLDQDLDGQVARLKAEGCGVIRSEKVSGGSREGRAELATILSFLRPGDELVVTRLDRLGRDTRDVLNPIHEAEEREAFVTVLDPHVSTRGEMGHIVLTVPGQPPALGVGAGRPGDGRHPAQPRDVIHHSDQGSQYTSLAFGSRRQEAGVRASMGSAGDA